MKLGETITAYDLATALADESGKFEVTSPSNETYILTCVPGHSITNLTIHNPQRQGFLIRKVANLGGWESNAT